MGLKFKISIIIFNFLFFSISYAKIPNERISKQTTSQQKNISDEAEVTKGNIEVIIDTSMGKIRLELFELKDPSTVKFFLNHAKKGYYNNTIFHRIIKGFIIQGGIYDKNFEKKNNHVSLSENRSYLEIKNTVGTIAIVHDPENPNSFTPEFFINLSNNSELDGTKEKQGYTVFGRIIKGMNVVKKIASVKTSQSETMKYKPFYPNEVIIKSVIIPKNS